VRCWHGGGAGTGDRRVGRGGQGADRRAFRATGGVSPARGGDPDHRKTLLELPEPAPPAPPTPKLPDHPAYQQIMAVFAAADAPLRARKVCEAMDLEIAPNTINNTRLKLKRLVGSWPRPSRACSPIRSRKPPWVAATCPLTSTKRQIRHQPSYLPLSYLRIGKIPVGQPTADAADTPSEK
jgi:hypothetical protein